ncbi:LysR family transcriptional regulator [Paraburkholderia sediminicola]|uniref:LysR family transcriptional regulator n=1 Tax=Paraburkholderia sediminicola TaxID=458836 RepID=UPI0038BA8387
MSRQREVIDIYLRRVLCAILTERSVTRAGATLNESQPAISSALKRLRDITGDPLLIRGKSGMVPTEYGLSLLGPAQNALRDIVSLGARPLPFEAALSLRCFRVGCPDYLDVAFLPAVVELFRASAPHATLELHPLATDFDFEVALEQGDLDLVVGNWTDPPEQLRLSNLFFDEIVCLVSDSHPFSHCGRLTAEQYTKSPHIASTPNFIRQRSFIDVHLARSLVASSSVAPLSHVASVYHERFRAGAMPPRDLCVRH